MRAATSISFRLIIVLPLFMLATLAYAQDAEKKYDINRVKPGMSERELIKAAGDPVKKESFRTIRTGTTDTTLYWLYENNITVIVKNHYVENVERDRNSILTKLQEWADPKNKDGIRVIYGK